VVRYVDMPPCHISPMHRTISLDYGFVLFGNVEVSRAARRSHLPLLTLLLAGQLSLPDGSRTPVKPGDVVVQRGTDHAWINASETEWARESSRFRFLSSILLFSSLPAMIAWGGIATIPLTICYPS
jgi:hypothetical protein